MAKINLISRKELTDLLKINPSTLRQWIKRGKMKESQEGFLNIYNLTNQDWIIEYSSKNNIDIKTIYNESKNSVPKPKLEKKKKELEEKLNEPDKLPEQSQSEYSKLRDNKLKIESDARSLDIELRQLEISKKKAKVIPVEFVIEMFNIYINTNIQGIITNGNKIIDQVVDEFAGNYQTKLKFKKEFRQLINETITKNHETISKDIIKKAKEYSLQRNW
jgi:hypothetical protein